MRGAPSATRRVVLSAAAWIALTGAGLAQAAFAGISDVRVDVGPMLARGAGSQAQVLRDDLTAALRQSFSDRIVGTDPLLLVRINALSLNAYAGGLGGRGALGGGGTQNDYLDGEAILVGRRGEVLARHPQLSVLPASSGGAWYDPASERRRVAAIADHYAAWLRRSLPGE